MLSGWWVGWWDAPGRGVSGGSRRVRGGWARSDRSSPTPHRNCPLVKNVLDLAEVVVGEVAPPATQFVVLLVGVLVHRLGLGVGDEQQGDRLGRPAGNGDRVLAGHRV